MGHHLGKRKRYAQIIDAYKAVIAEYGTDITSHILKDWIINKVKEKLVSDYGFKTAPSGRTINRALNMSAELRREVALWKLEKSLKNT